MKHIPLIARLATAALATVLLFGHTSALGQASPSPFTSGTRYDASGRVTGTIAPDPDGGGSLAFAAVRNTYDAAGRLIRVESGELSAWQSELVAPANWSGFTIVRAVETSYDSMGRKTRDTVREGAAGTVRTVTQYSYDALGRLQCTAVRMNEAVFGSVPASACTLGPEGSDGPDRITRNYYDAAGQLLQERRGVGTPDEQAYGTYSYSLGGQRTSVTDANGNRAEMTYDGHGRQRRWIFPSSTTAGQANAADYEEYGYDPNGNRTSYRKRDGLTLTFQYDALNRMAVKVIPERSGLDPVHTRDVYYAYDLRGLQTRARFDNIDGPGITNEYDGFGRLSLSRAEMGWPARILTYQYDADGNRTRIMHPDGNWFGYGYDGLDRLELIQENGAAVIAQGYNNAGLRAWMARSGPYVSFGYDALGRLTGFGHDFTGAGQDLAWSLWYNPASQIRSSTRSNDLYAWTNHYNVSRDYSRNGLNEFTAIATAGGSALTPQYDANGNLIFDGTRTFTYDVENRLVGTSDGVSLGYDPVGRLLWTTGSPNYATFLYDGDDLVAEYDYNAALVRRYVHGSGADEPVVWYEGPSVGTANRRQLYANHQGSITAVADSNGAVIAANTYDPWGIPGTGGLGRFRYTGQVWLEELGLYYYKARMYSPTLGRFMQVDPVGYDGGINLYAYVLNDPVNLNDPDGQIPEPAVGPMSASIEHFWNSLSPETRATALRVGGDLAVAVGAVIDVADTPVSPGPDASLAGAGIRAGLREAAERQVARGMQNPVVREAVQNGRNAHRTLGERAAQRGWRSNPRGLRDVNGRSMRPDAMTRRGQPVEFKPNTPTGIRRGEQQIQRYEQGTGRRGRLVCYDPITHHIVPCGS